MENTSGSDFISQYRGCLILRLHTTKIEECLNFCLSSVEEFSGLEGAGGRMNTFLHFLQLNLQKHITSYRKYKPQMVVFILLLALVLPFQNCGGKFKSVLNQDVQLSSATQDNSQPTPTPTAMAVFFRLSEAIAAQGEPAIFDLILDNPANEDLVFELKISDGQALAGEHYISLIQHLSPQDTFVVPEAGGAGNANLFKIKRGSMKASFQVPTIRKIPATTELEFSVSAEVNFKGQKFVKDSVGRVKLAQYKPLELLNLSTIADGNFTCLQNLDQSVDCKGVLVTDRGMPQNNVNLAAFTRVPQFQNAKSFAAGPHSACVLSEAGVLSCIGDPPQKSFPALKSIAMGYSYLCGLDMAGAVICDGPNGSSVFAPNVAFNEAVTNLVGGYDHLCAETASKKYYCWGFNLNGQVGSGSIEETGTTYFPAAVVMNSSQLGFSKIYAGAVSSCAVAADQKFYCWGHVFAKGKENSGTPILMGLTDVKDVAISYNKICALHGADKWTCFHGDGLKNTGTITGGTNPVLLAEQLVVRAASNKWHCPESEVAIDLLGAQCWP